MVDPTQPNIIFSIKSNTCANPTQYTELNIYIDKIFSNLLICFQKLLII